MRISRIPEMEHMPLNPAGYTIERLPFSFVVSFARGHDVYFGDAEGRLYKGDDAARSQKPVKIGNFQITPQYLVDSDAKQPDLCRDADRPGPIQVYRRILDGFTR